MYQSKIIYLAAVFIILLFCSCAQVKENPQQNGTALLTDIPSQVVVAVSEGLSIDADVVVPAGLATKPINIYSAQKMVFGEKNAYRVFFGDEPFASRKEHSVKKNGLHSTFYTLENGSTLLAGANDCSFQTPLSQYVKNVFIDDGVDPNYNVPLYAAQPELSFETKDGAFAVIKELASNLGVTVCDQYQGYAMPHEVMREESKMRIQTIPYAAGDYKTEWTQDEDCYIFRLSAYVEPLPVMREDHGLLDDGTLVLGSTIDAIYSANGIEQLYISHVYQTTGVVQENISIISFDDALARAQTLVDSVIITGTMCIEHIRLQYIPMKADKADLLYTLVPAWSFQVANTIKLDTGVTVTLRNWIHLSAETGEEIV